VYFITAEDNPMGTWAHELGHDLLLPDLYDTTGGPDSEGIGHYGLMGSGSWCGPTHLLAFEKSQLGWLSITPVSTAQCISIPDVETNAVAYRVTTSDPSQYFIVENRWRGTSFDNVWGWEGNLNDQGLLIYHIDEGTYNSKYASNTVNGAEEHKAIDIECADFPTSHVVNADNLDREDNRGDQFDLWDSSEYAFSDISAPCSAIFYSGANSGVKILAASAPAATMQISFFNIPPIAEANGPYSGTEGTAIVLDASGSSDVDGNPLQYRWDINGDGTFEIDWTTDATVEYTWCDDGVYTVTLEVTDGLCTASSDTATVTVTNVPPVAIAKPATQTVYEGQEAWFDAIDSYDPGCDTLSYHWDFGNGVWYADVQATTVTYCEVGSYTVTLTVSDGDGGVSTTTVTVTVNNVAPVADAGPDQTVNEGDTVSFSGSATSDAGFCDTLSYEWTFGDGTPAVTGTLTPTYVYCDNGVYTVMLTVTDDEGTKVSDTLLVTVNNVPPVADAGPDQTVNEGDTVSFSGSATDAGSCDVLSYSWNFGDGTSAVTGTLTPTHEYCDNGVYTVTLTVTDDDGASVSDTLTVTVNNVAPTVTKGAMDQPNPEFILPIVHTLTFHATFSDPGWCDTHTALWSFGDGQTDVGTPTEENIQPDATGTVTTTHAYGAPGDYLVTVTVTDDDGGATVSESWSVHVADVVEAKHITAAYIQNLPDSAFRNNPNERKNAFSNMFNALDNMIASGAWNGFTTSIQSNIRGKADGLVDGKPGDDWIIDLTAQQHICMKIDDIVAYVETLS